MTNLIRAYIGIQQKRYFEVIDSLFENNDKQAENEFFDQELCKQFLIKFSNEFLTAEFLQTTQRYLPKRNLKGRQLMV